MISRALVIALCCAYATTLAPIAAPDDDDCALYLTGPGRSSAYDYTLNLLKGNFAYDGQHTCITYEAINQAYLDARTRILVAQPKGDWGAEDFASVGELLLDISVNLARTYGLTYEEIEKGLPLIDTSRTHIREVCPPVFSHVECRAGKYRRLDGLCNNLRHPTWGATMAPFQRLIGPLYADGINAPRISHSGRELPLSRVVSRTMHQDEGYHDHAGTVMVIAWGQFMDHDYTLTGTPLDPRNRNDPEECCKRPQHLKHPYCNEIRIPDDDYFYRLFGVKCIDFVRAFPSPRPGCRLGSRVPFNTLTGTIDGNTVYGVTDKFGRKLRTGYGGLLRMNPVFEEYGLKDLLPLKLDIPDEGCTRPNKNMYCFEAGEIRVNEQLVLTVMHTLMAREHNRVAKALAQVNPHWDDETLYQEARRINIAEIQHITYNEFLPILLGKDVMEKFGLVLQKEGYWDGYDPEVNPDVIASFAAAAYRFGHSLLPTAVERWSKAHKFIASKRLSDLIRRPYDLYRAGVLDEYVMGLMNQVAQAMDDSITQEVTNHLFKKVGARFGMDLVSFNMQRGREFGIPGYMEFRKFCGLSGAESFQDLFDTMANDTVRRYETIFEHPVDVDLWSGGVSERPLPGSMLGPTFACIIATQYSYSRRGDRFWFELPNQPSSFTPEQLHELRKSRLARIICDNTDIIDTVQLYPFVLPDHELNPRVPCRSGIIPSMDFSKWAEPAPFVGAAKEYMTVANATNLFGENYATNCTEINQNIKQESLIDNGKDHHKNIPSDTEMTLLRNPIDNNSSIYLHKENTSLPIVGVKSWDNLTQSNDRSINNTLLKYVYSNKHKKPTAEKQKGHFKNSLLREKRSQEGLVKESINEAPASFEYTTSHNPKEREDLQNWQTQPTVINSADLADFNIETLHTNETPNTNKIRPNTPYGFKLPLQDETSSESSENKKGQNAKSDSSENLSSLTAQDSNESSEIIDDLKTRPLSRTYDNSRENIRLYPQRNRKDESSEEKNVEHFNSSDESKEYLANYAKSDPNSNSNSNENSNENNENIVKSPYDSIENENLNTTVHDNNRTKIFRNEKDEYEGIQNSNKYTTEHTLYINPTESQETTEKIKENILAFKDSNYSSESDSLNDKKPVKINDDEVKPVIELNSESSEESHEELHEEANSKLKQDNDSKKDLNAFIDIKQEGKTDVKQQFERIPLNYNHDADKKDDTKENSPKEIISVEKYEITHTTPKYDENLNFKFGDITVTLPEIKLPEDILDFTTESASENDEENYYFLPYKNKERSQESSDENPNEKVPVLYEDYSSFIKNDFKNAKSKQKSKYNYYDDKNDDDDDDYDDDPYEKFVRERFGKRGSFQKRSEKLTKTDPIVENKKMYKTLQNVLKKTQEIQKEADKNGKPKADYLWTLEYGQNLK